MVQMMLWFADRIKSWLFLEIESHEEVLAWTLVMIGIGKDFGAYAPINLDGFLKPQE
ncbi:hypothetical protein H8E77_31070 [bacterium]|nr:hypothetical protein [bacterium]